MALTFMFNNEYIVQIFLRFSNTLQLLMNSTQIYTMNSNVKVKYKCEAQEIQEEQ